MKKITLLTIIFCSSLIFACDSNSDLNQKNGSWILYERGYSPGAGYITEDVSEQPPQTLSLNVDGTMKTSIKGMEEYKYYLILNDEKDEAKILALFKTKPLDRDPSKLEHSYRMSTDEEGNLRLNFRWCIEGCHLALRKQ
jgi:hypothetical protein